MRGIRLSFVAAITAVLALPFAAHAGDTNSALLQAVSARSDEDRARDGARHPAETLAFFQVKPGMTVAEALPGGGWYTKILANYLRGNGALYGVNYPDKLWPLFGFLTPEKIEERVAQSSW
jgi:predicted methyltransferase